jgi:hypothetical protein
MNWQQQLRDEVQEAWVRAAGFARIDGVPTHLFEAPVPDELHGAMYFPPGTTQLLNQIVPVMTATGPIPLTAR